MRFADSSIMLVTKQPVMRRFWYPIMPMSYLDEGPKGFVLLGYPIVLWKNQEGKPAAVFDRCPHRSAKLSLGWVTDGRVVCPYHGWEFDCSGQCQSVPQIGDKVPNRNLRVQAFHCEERYGYAWVALEDPLYELPVFDESTAEGFRQIDEFYEKWNCAGLRLMENSFDAAHIAFVHRDSFGDINNPIPARGEITRTEHSFYMDMYAAVDNEKIDKSVLQMEDATTVRKTRTTYFPPMIRRSRIEYPNGLVHAIVTCATPIDDGSSQIVQFCFRNDTEAEVPAESVVAFDRRVVEEDKAVLESTCYDTPIDMKRRAELHMFSDRPGMLIREIVLKLLKDHGEEESQLPDESLGSVHYGSRPLPDGVVD